MSLPRTLGQHGAAHPPGGPKPGDVLQSAKFFFLPMTFDGVSLMAQSQIIDFDVIVRGLTTNIAFTSRVQLIDPDRNYQFSSDFVPLAVLAGAAARNDIYQWFRRPYLLAARQPLRGVQDTPAAGDIVLLCEKRDTQQKHVIPPTSKPYYLHLSWRFTGIANQVVSADSTPCEHDLLLLGASYSAAASTNTVRIYDESANTLWSLNSLRFEYFFGLQANNQPMLWYPRPYFLPRGSKLHIEATNATAVTRTDYLDFSCITL